MQVLAEEKREKHPESQKRICMLGLQSIRTLGQKVQMTVHYLTVTPVAWGAVTLVKKGFRQGTGQMNLSLKCPTKTRMSMMMLVNFSWVATHMRKRRATLMRTRSCYPHWESHFRMCQRVCCSHQFRCTVSIQEDISASARPKTRNTFRFVFRRNKAHIPSVKLLRSSLSTVRTGDFMQNIFHFSGLTVLPRMFRSTVQWSRGCCAKYSARLGIRMTRSFFSSVMQRTFNENQVRRLTNKKHWTNQHSSVAPFRSMIYLCFLLSR